MYDDESDVSISMQLTELHSTMAVLIELCLCVMNVYQEELHRSTGSKESIWNTDVKMFQSFEIAEDANIFRLCLR